MLLSRVVASSAALSGLRCSSGVAARCASQSRTLLASPLSSTRRYVGARATEGGDGEASSSSQPPSAPSSAPRTRPGAQAPLKLERVENLASTSWAGVAKVDSGEADGGGLARSLVLAVGDGAALVAFAAIGRAQHGEPLALFDVLGTAAPFLISWYGWGLTGFGRAFGREARLASAGGGVAASVARNWLPFLPTAQALRALSVGHVADATFWGISGGVTLLFLVAWRSALAAASPAPGANKRGDKKGNPFEFLSLLKSLTTRW